MRDLRHARASGHLDLRWSVSYGANGERGRGEADGHDVDFQGYFGVCFGVLGVAAPCARQPEERKEDGGGSELECGFALPCHCCGLCVYGIVLRGKERLLCVHCCEAICVSSLAESVRSGPGCRKVWRI
jgi:hypothetical protein